MGLLCNGQHTITPRTSYAVKGSKIGEPFNYRYNSLLSVSSKLIRFVEFKFVKLKFSKF